MTSISLKWVFSQDISNLFGKIAVLKIPSALFACHSSLVKLLSNAPFIYYALFIIYYALCFYLTIQYFSSLFWSIAVLFLMGSPNLIKPVALLKHIFIYLIAIFNSKLYSNKMKKWKFNKKVVSNIINIWLILNIFFVKT
jgi:hypothetical protein